MPYAVAIEQLKKTYSNGVNALAGISFRVEEGSFTAFLGKNGAGKSTTINIISTLLAPTEGEVHIFGHQLGVEDDAIRQEIGVVFQHPMLDGDLTVEENLRIRASFYRLSRSEAKKKIDELLSTLGIESVRKQKYKQLSGGQKRKADIARALLHSPRLLILDEPTTGLDPKSRKDLWDYILKLQQTTSMTLLLTTHYLDEVTDADVVVVIHEGQIKENATSQALRERYTKTKLRTYHSEAIQQLIHDKAIDHKQLADRVDLYFESSKTALAFVNEYPSLFDHFEILQGSMDDVFLSLTEGEAV
jgi:multidrug/hemolysin transport system ATP-binding protein